MNKHLSREFFSKIMLSFSNSFLVFTICLRIVISKAFTISIRTKSVSITLVRTFSFLVGSNKILNIGAVEFYRYVWCRICIFPIFCFYCLILFLALINIISNKHIYGVGYNGKLQTNSIFVLILETSWVVSVVFI